MAWKDNITNLMNPKINKWIPIVIAISAGIIIVSLIQDAISQKRESAISDINIHVIPLADGSKLITEKNILTTLTRSIGKTPKGMAMKNLDLGRIEERVLEKDPFIAEADVYIDARNVLHIDIQQRQPFLRIIDAKGRNYYLDVEGKRMPTSVNFTARVPVATGYIPSYTPEYQSKRNGTLRHLFQFTEKIQKDEFMNALTEQIFVTQKREFVIIPKLGRQKLFFGRNNSVEKKIRRLKVFYQEGVPYKGWQQYASIDLRYKGQVICKK